MLVLTKSAPCAHYFLIRLRPGKTGTYFRSLVEWISVASQRRRDFHCLFRRFTFDPSSLFVFPGPPSSCIFPSTSGEISLPSCSPLRFPSSPPLPLYPPSSPPSPSPPSPGFLSIAIIRLSLRRRLVSVALP